MLLLDDEALFERCSFLRDHGRSKEKAYFNTEVAYKYMPFNLQASLGYAQFQRIEELVAEKRSILEAFKNHLSHLDDLFFNTEPTGGRNGAWCSILMLGESYDLTKTNLMKLLENKGLDARPFFYPLSSMPAYGEQGSTYKHQNPISYKISEKAICLPSAFGLSEHQIQEYAAAISDILQEER